MSLAMNTRKWRYFVFWIIIWTFLVSLSGFLRPLLPYDETLYTSVAWEMWIHHHFLVPLINGHPYAMKPPLLFWLFEAGWAVFGVNDWWPRLAPALLGLANLFLIFQLAKRIWPNDHNTRFLAPTLFSGSLIWMIYAPATLFDMLLTFCTLLATLGLVQVIFNQKRQGFWWLALGIGLGLLTKGPVVLLFILIPALLAPIWFTKLRRWRAYFAPLLSFTLIGIAIALLWVIPAVIKGGAAYRHDLLWTQTIDRIFHSGHHAFDAHYRPTWWYLMILPIVLLPWTLWVPTWKGIFKRSTISKQPAQRWLGASLLTLLIILSLIKGKQIHYLMPMVPLLVLWLAPLLTAQQVSRWHQLFYALFLIALGTALLIFPHTSIAHQMDLARLVPTISGALIILVGLGVGFYFDAKINNQVISLNVSLLALFSILFLFIVHPLSQRFNIKPIATRIAALQAKGIPVAHVGYYQGQYQFLGRLTQPLTIISFQQLPHWVKTHPRAWFIYYQGHFFHRLHAKPAFSQAYPPINWIYPHQTVGLWSADTLLRDQIQSSQLN